jgi:hypothetical protein
MPREGNRNESDERKAYEPQEHEKKEPCPSREPVMGSQPHRIGRSPCSQLQIGNLFKSGPHGELIAACDPPDDWRRPCALMPAN